MRTQATEPLKALNEKQRIQKLRLEKEISNLQTPKSSGLIIHDFTAKSNYIEVSVRLHSLNEKEILCCLKKIEVPAKLLTEPESTDVEKISFQLNITEEFPFTPPTLTCKTKVCYNFRILECCIRLLLCTMPHAVLLSFFS